MTAAVFCAICAAGFAALCAVLAVRLHAMKKSRDRLILLANNAREVAKRKSAEAASSMSEAQYFRALAQQVWTDSKALYDRYRALTERQEAGHEADD